ncbi:MAG: YeeE/YedE family protein [Nitrospirae bacterium]|nr:YeeE/YedE family protein [Nitrospirota bacterium]
MESEALQGVSLAFIVTGLLCGGLVGLILQRGRFCMNSAFRDIIFIKEYNLFQAYLIALIIMLIGGNALADMGIIHLKAQTFYPLANIIGGYLFGIGMVLAGGCGSGIIYRVGEGQVASIVAVFCFLFGIGATTNGILKPVYDLLRSVKLAGAEGAPYTLHGFLGDDPMMKWIVIGVLCVGCFVYVLTGKPFAFGKQKGFFWSVAGSLIGVMGLVTFWASENWGSPGFARGMNFTTPAGETMFTFLIGDARSKFFPMFDLAGFKVTWGEFFYIGVPIGAFISAKILREFKWKIPPAQEMLTVMGGSFLMGFSASVAGGCNVGQALTGFTTLSIGSIAATIAIVLGNWTMVYYKFIKPMEDI